MRKTMMIRRWTGVLIFVIVLVMISFRQLPSSPKSQDCSTLRWHKTIRTTKGVGSNYCSIVKRIRPVDIIAEAPSELRPGARNIPILYESTIEPIRGQSSFQFVHPGPILVGELGNHLRRLRWLLPDSRRDSAARNGNLSEGGPSNLLFLLC